MISRTRIAAVVSVILLATCALGATVHLRLADGSWVELDATEQDGTVSFSLGPDQATGGRALVVINRPDWMVLEDETPPRVTGYSIGDLSRELDGVSELTLGALGDADWNRRVVIRVADNANPIDVDSLRLDMPGVFDVPVALVREDREAHFAEIELDLSGAGPGAYSGTLEISDLAPTHNTIDVPISFSIAGVEIAQDMRTIRLSAAGASFTAAGDGRANIGVDGSGAKAYITLQAGAAYYYLGEFTRVQKVDGVAGWQVVEADASLETVDGDPVPNEDAGISLSYRFAIHPDHPLVLVQSEATNLADTERNIYMFWGWLPGEGYVTEDGEHEWSMAYKEIGHPGWVYLPATGAGHGTGWISEALFGESRFGTMLLYTDPKDVAVAPGETVSQLFALMPADEPDEVAEQARWLLEQGVLSDR